MVNIYARCPRSVAYATPAYCETKSFPGKPELTSVLSLLNRCRPRLKAFESLKGMLTDADATRNDMGKPAMRFGLDLRALQNDENEYSDHHSYGLSSS